MTKQLTAAAIRRLVEIGLIEEMRIDPRPAMFKRWTAEDEGLLQTMLDAKTSRDLIARKLKRSRYAIEKRIVVLRKKRAFS